MERDLLLLILITGSNHIAAWDAGGLGGLRDLVI